jgi:hypothetical protein
VFSAFFELSTCRHDSGPIPWTAIHLYAEAYEYPFEWFSRLIRDMDVVYVAHLNKKSAKAAPVKGALGKKGRR